MNRFVDKGSYIFAGVTFLIGLILFYSQTGLFWGSLAAAIIAGGMAWVAYVLTRWLYLALFK